jgi:hypothetical protein
VVRRHFGLHLFSWSEPNREKASAIGPGFVPGPRPSCLAVPKAETIHSEATTAKLFPDRVSHAKTLFTVETWRPGEMLTRTVREQRATHGGYGGPRPCGVDVHEATIEPIRCTVAT